MVLVAFIWSWFNQLTSRKSTSIHEIPGRVASSVRQESQSIRKQLAASTWIYLDADV